MHKAILARACLGSLIVYRDGLLATLKAEIRDAGESVLCNELRLALSEVDGTIDAIKQS